MLVPRWLSPLVLAVIGVAAAAALTACATAAWSFVHYRPSAVGVDPMLLDGAARSTSTWLDVHRVSLGVALALALIVLAAAPGVVAEAGRGPRRPVVAGLVALLGAGSAAIGAMTTALVTWEQVALEEVTVGTDLAGWRLAAMDDKVLFVVIGGAEVSPGTYAVSLALHLAAPVVALAALVGVALLVVGARRRRAAGPGIATP